MTATDEIAQISPVVRYLEPQFDGQAAEILAAAVVPPTTEAAAATIAGARADDDAQLLELLVDGKLAGAYILRKVGMANEISCLAIDEAHRKQGLGRMCLMDALLRSGRRPLMVETGEECFPFFKAIGFKLVGKRKNADGVVRYRLGWHAPAPKPDGSGLLQC